MVQKGEKRPRGRPRAYDPDVALQRAREAFADGGFSGTSLDDLSDRMGMNRPSLYAAFGDKEALYLKTLREYLEARRAMVAELLSAGRPLRETLSLLLRGMIDAFLEGDQGARGCYLVGTAATEAVTNPEVRKILAASMSDLERGLSKAFAAAKASGELGSGADPQALALIMTGLTHSLALRARAGQSRATLQQAADATLKLIWSGAPDRGQQESSRMRRSR